MAEPSAAHLRRDACIYVRQSTLAQMTHNTELRFLASVAGSWRLRSSLDMLVATAGFSELLDDSGRARWPLSSVCPPTLAPGAVSRIWRTSVSACTAV